MFTLAFWENLFSQIENLGPLPGILFAMVEAFLPVLPLTGIVIFNVAAYGFWCGFLYTWIGATVGSTITFLFFRYVYHKIEHRFNNKNKTIEKARVWVSGFDTTALFIIMCIPYTPSSFVNLAFGVSDYPVKKYLLTLYPAKLLMIIALSYFGESITTALEKPLQLALCIVAMIGLYIISRLVRKKHNL